MIESGRSAGSNFESMVIAYSLSFGRAQSKA
jgi:hypothetical protein